MKIKRIISIILITILTLSVLNFNSFATESVNIIETPDISVEENTNNNDNQEDNTNIGNENSGENSDTGADNNEAENNTDNNIDSGNNESTDNSNETENNTDNNIATDNNAPNNNNETNNNVGTDNNVPNDNNNQTNNNEEVPDQNVNEPVEQPVEQPPVQNEEPPVSEPIVSAPTNDSVVETKSENANLRTLILDVEGISPEFDKNITEYYLIVDLSVEEINIEAYPEDGKSIIFSIEGNTDLKEGQNTIEIVVRAEAGNTKTYTINVTKTDDVELVNANLKNLTVKGFNFYPSFKNNIYGYTLTINEKVSQLEIMAETENEAATYEILGNENLNEGDNLIKVIVTAQDGETKREYKINVFMDSKKVQVQETSKLPAIVLLAFIGIAIVGTSVAISKKH